MSSVYHIRDFREADRAFVKATFLRGMYHGDSWFSVMPKDLFMRNYALIIEALIAKNLIQVACLTDDPDVIIGYSLISPDFQVMHWVFVKKAFRGLGIGKALIPMSIKVVTHLTKPGKSLMDKYKAIFNPFAI